jgi:hypothetical protein
MEIAKAPWFHALGLKKEDFAQLPADRDPLLWGLEQGVIAEAPLNQWVSENFKIPRIQPEFFSLAVDFNLLQSYSHLYEWSPTCYPVYLWEETLFIACVSPENIFLGNQKHCLIAAPYSAMKQAWDRQHSAEHSSPADGDGNTFDPGQAPVSLITEDATVVIPQQTEPALTIEINSASLDDLELPPLSVPEPPTPAVVSTPPPQLPPTPESLGDLDFSSLDGLSSDSKPPAPPTMEETEVVEPTNTKVDKNQFQQFTTATETVHAKKEESELDSADLPFPDMDFDKMTVGDIALEGEASKKQASIPEPPRPMPMAKNEIEEEESVSVSVPSAEEYDDDYTPVPFISEADKAKFKYTNVEMGQIKRPDGPIERTLTDDRPPSQVPFDNMITDTDMSRALDLKHCRQIKDIVAHMFMHLKRDYRKLMWVEGNAEGLYIPRYIYGDWSPQAETWTTPVDLIKPNIFRIASVSNLPFHGPVSENEINQKYFDLWTGGKAPDAATIYPVSNQDDQLKGFIVCFSINEEFDQDGSLQKIDNLLSICRRYLFDEKLQQSA